ncbi:MAG: MFS transporter [Caulobacterales bacterium]|nr:MFS transporter [Caulobacterales bacterium]
MGLLSLLYVISFADRLVLSVLVGPIKQELGASDAQLGLLMGLSFAGVYSVLCLVLARVADRGDRRNLIVAGVVIWSLTTIACAFAPNFLTLALCRTGVGIGEAALTPAALSMIASLFPAERRHGPISVFLAAGVLGATGGFMMAAAALDLVHAGDLAQLPFLAHLSSWRVVMLVMGAPGLVLAALLALTVREPPRPPAPAEASSAGEVLREFALNRRLYLAIFAGLGFIQLMAYALGAWYPAILVRGYALTPSQAGYLFGALGATFGVGGALAVPALVASLAKRGRRDAFAAVGAVCLLAAAPCVIAGLLWPSASGSLAWMAPSLFLLIGGGTLPAVAVQVIAPSRVRAQVTAVYFLGVNFIGLGGAPWLVGALSDRLPGASPLATGLAIVVALCALAGGACCFAFRSAVTARAQIPLPQEAP